MKNLVIRKHLRFIICTGLIFLKNTGLHAQTALDSINYDYRFGNLSLVEILKIKTLYSQDSLTSVDNYLKHKGFVGETKKQRAYFSAHDDYVCEFDSQSDLDALNIKSLRVDDPALVLRSASASFKQDVLEFIRRERWAEDLYSNDYQANETETVLFSDFNNDKRLCAVISSQNTFLIFY